MRGRVYGRAPAFHPAAELRIRVGQRALAWAVLSSDVVSECNRAKVNAQGWSEILGHVCPCVVRWVPSMS
jgi:hypothetical protein